MVVPLLQSTDYTLIFVTVVLEGLGGGGQQPYRAMVCSTLDMKDRDKTIHKEIRYFDCREYPKDY